MVEIGNTNFQPSWAFQKAPELTWNVGVHPNHTVEIPTTHNLIQRYENPITFNYTDFNKIQSKFTQVTNDAANFPNWEYAPFLLLDEPFHPYIMATWGNGTPLASWILDGTHVFNGVTVKLLKTWYVEKYGSWNQNWWNNILSSKTPDNIILKWSSEYAKGLYEAWNIHVHKLGKKSATLDSLVGLSSTNFTRDFEIYYYPSPMREYIMANYDMVVYQKCPKTTADITAAVQATKDVKQKYGFKGKLGYIMGSCWTGAESSTSCPFSMSLYDSEFIAIYPYVDIILTWAYDIMNWADFTKSTIMPPHLIQLYKNYVPCLPSQCDFTITQ